MKHLIAAAGLAATGCLAQGALAADYTMRISHQWNTSLPSGRAVDAFEKAVEEKTGGRVDVQVYPAAQLYKPNQQHAAVASGEIEALVMPDFMFGGTIPELVVSLIPFLVRDPEAVRGFRDSAAAEILEGKLRAKGLEPIGWLVESLGGIYTSNGAPLDTPEAFQGVKIRGLTPLYDKGLAAAGATPTAMPAVEIYQALQTGVIDATVTSVSGAVGRKFFEVQDYGVVTPFSSFAKNVFAVNPSWWSGLPEDIRTAISEAADALWEPSVEQNIDPANDPGIAALRDGGMEVEILDPAAIAKLAEVMAPPVIAAFEEMGDDARELIRVSKSE